MSSLSDIAGAARWINCLKCRQYVSKKSKKLYTYRGPAKRSPKSFA